MSLIEDVKKHYEHNHYPPYDEIEDAEVANEEILDKLRWGNLKQWVLQRGDEYVAIKDVEPATENQDWGDYGDPDIYEVKPVTKTVVTYVKA